MNAQTIIIFGNVFVESRSIPIVGTDLIKGDQNGLLPGEVTFGYGTQVTLSYMEIVGLMNS
jgi:hypothetical protein